MPRSHRPDKEKFDITLQQIQGPNWKFTLGRGFEDLRTNPLQTYPTNLETRKPIDKRALERIVPQVRAMYHFGTSQTIHRDNPSLIHAMGTFHREVGQAAEFYQSFKQQFDQEISQMTYLSKPNLNAIWTERVMEKRQGDDVNQGADTSQNHAPKFCKKFEDTKRSLMRSAKEVLEFIDLAWTRAKDPNSGALVDPAKHFREKVSLAFDQTKELMEWAALSPDACEALTRELNSLKELVNPDSERVKDLYKSKNLEEES
ncbi:hypothetical protein HYALB_00003767 [Hymenoscyphus albidus]|uniref:Uncharacterized protein n=1 Tax=Hymenoscyphus albidus TaxID=595503 RepID=A0A9N9LVY1_9HELO|nr:hypothetical protein HYALB_00003767 [Hymenoscyphus albidus]